ncbi:hypothetical protein Tco_1575545 [Tanacetum coccineum]
MVLEMSFKQVIRAMYKEFRAEVSNVSNMHMLAIISDSNPVIILKQGGRSRCILDSVIGLLLRLASFVFEVHIGMMIPLNSQYPAGRNVYIWDLVDLVICVLRISGLYTSRLLDAACKKVLNLLKKGLLVKGEAKTTSTPTSPTTQAQVTYVSESVSYLKFEAKTFVDPHGFEGYLKMVVEVPDSS